MKVLVLNGSPKGKYSFTLQTSLYLEKRFPEHNFQVLHVSQQLKSIEKDFSAVSAAINEADLIVFSYPVYTFIAPSQFHRFIELLKESGVDVTGKFATQITTSKHFYDVTAHQYIMDNCQDLGLKYIKGLSADMDDLLTENGQKNAKDFFEYVYWSVKHDVYETIRNHVTAAKKRPISSFALNEEEKSIEGDVVIVTDCAKDDQQLSDMINRFRAVLKYRSRIVNIAEYPFSGGCVGCFHCAATGKCFYKDGFDEFLHSNIQTADAIIYAFTIKDHSMGSTFKMYDDRRFCDGHRSVTMGKPTEYLSSGNYASETNLQMIN